MPVDEGDGDEAGEVSEELLPGQFPEGAAPPPDHTPLLRHGPRGHRAVGTVGSVADSPRSAGKSRCKWENLLTIYSRVSSDSCQRQDVKC